jgi:hypothetical protein
MRRGAVAGFSPALASVVQLRTSWEIEMRKPIIALFALLGLSACAGMEERPMFGRGETAPINGTQKGRLRKDHWLEIGAYATINSKCRFVSVPRITVTRRPTHGQIKIFRQYGRGGYGFEHCNDIDFNGLTLRYTPRPGFVGPDQFAYRVVFTNGEIRNIGMDVDIVDE